MDVEWRSHLLNATGSVVWRLGGTVLTLFIVVHRCTDIEKEEEMLSLNWCKSNV